MDAILDQWELQPGDDIPHFMETNLASAHRVLMICTDQYVKKANVGTGGVGYEKMIVTSDLMKSIDSNKVIPIIRQAGAHLVPTFLKSKLFIDFSRDDDTEYAFDELVRTLVGKPLFQKPAVGNNPFKPVAETPVERSADAVLELMRVVVSLFEKSTTDYLFYSDVVKNSSVSRILLDFTIEKAVNEGLITRDSIGLVCLTGAGKHYAILHKLIRS